MNSFARNGWTILTSETAYKANIGLFGVIMPSDGGNLQSDGTWTRNAGVIASDFYQELAGLANDNDQLYLPNLYGTIPAVATVLASSSLRATAISGAISLALNSFDSPWDGIMLDLENIQIEYQDDLSSFLTDLSTSMALNGLTLAVATNGRVNDTYVEGSPLYTYDYAVLADNADYVVPLLYDYIRPDPVTAAPYWWIKGCIDYALSQGVTRQQLVVAFGNFTRYWDVTGETDRVDISIADGEQLITDESSYKEWVEENGNGLVRETFATIDTGHLYMSDADVMEHKLALLEEYSLVETGLFIPGMGESAQYTHIQNWVNGVSVWHGYIGLVNSNMSAGDFTDFFDLFTNQGRLTHSQPSNITHTRTPNAANRILEAVFRDGELSTAHTADLLAIILDVDATTISTGQTTPTYLNNPSVLVTFTHSATDQAQLIVFGGWTATWAESGDECREYVESL